MKPRTYVLLSASIFAVVALVHLIRLSQGWTVQLGPYAIPPGASWIGLVLAAALSWWGFASLRR
jgi:hypothetical protein